MNSKERKAFLYLPDAGEILFIRLLLNELGDDVKLKDAERTSGRDNGIVGAPTLEPKL